MKKVNLLNKSAIFLVVASLTVTALTGCQSKSSQQSANTNAVATQNSNNNGNGGNNGSGSNAENRKMRMQDALSSLVSDGTINQTQSDKILAALTANPQGFGGRRNRQNSNQNNGQNSTQNNQLNNAQGGQQNGTQPNGQNRQRFNPLSKLVQDGVITQAQSDAVMQKIRGNFSRPQNNQNQGQNQDQSQSSNQ